MLKKEKEEKKKQKPKHNKHWAHHSLIQIIFNWVQKSKENVVLNERQSLIKISIKQETQQYLLKKNISFYMKHDP